MRPVLKPGTTWTSFQSSIVLDAKHMGHNMFNFVELLTQFRAKYYFFQICCHDYKMWHKYRKQFCVCAYITFTQNNKGGYIPYTLNCQLVLFVWFVSFEDFKPPPPELDLQKEGYGQGWFNRVEWCWLSIHDIHIQSTLACYYDFACSMHYTMNAASIITMMMMWHIQTFVLP